jgi:hypothetical protein
LLGRGKRLERLEGIRRRKGFGWMCKISKRWHRGWLWIFDGGRLVFAIVRGYGILSFDEKGVIEVVSCRTYTKTTFGIYNVMQHWSCTDF